MEYDTTAVDRLYKKCLPKLSEMSESLRYTTNFYGVSKEELLQEATILFFKNFESYYENINQYQRFIFICLKNKLRNIQKSTYNYENKYKAPVDVKEEADFWGNIEDTNDLWYHYEFWETMRESYNRMDEKSKNILKMICEDKNKKQISVETGLSVRKIEEIIKINIQPLFVDLVQ